MLASGKGKIERPYRWLQDRIVRACALENLTALKEVRGVYVTKSDRYNNHQVHSTTGEIPSLRFENARKSGTSLFRPFSLPTPYSSHKDVFACAKPAPSMAMASSHSSTIKSMCPMFRTVKMWSSTDPDLARQALEVRIWFEQKMVHSLTLPLADSRVHF